METGYGIMSFSNTHPSKGEPIFCDEPQRWPSIKNTIRGKVVASPKSKPWWILRICLCMWFVHAPKVLQLRTNQLFDFCRFVWVIELLVTLPNPHPKAPACPFTPKVLQAKERAPTPYAFVVFTLGSHLNPSRSLGVRHSATNWLGLYYVTTARWMGFCNVFYAS